MLNKNEMREVPGRIHTGEEMGSVLPCTSQLVYLLENQNVKFTYYVVSPTNRAGVDLIYGKAHIRISAFRLRIKSDTDIYLMVYWLLVYFMG